MELEIKKESKSPISTFEKSVKGKVYFSIDKLTSTYQLTTDQIFKIFKNNNKDILDNLISEEKQFIERDNNCRCVSMKSTINNYSRKCKGCQLISRLIKTNYLTSSKIEIYSGRQKNSFIRIKNYSSHKIGYERNESIESVHDYIVSVSGILDNKTKDEKHYVTSNNFYNYLINSIIREKISKRDKILTGDIFLWGFICREELTILKKINIFKNLEDLCKSPYYSNYSSPFNNINKERKLSLGTISFIIKQLIYFLKKMEPFHLIHGRPSINFISYSNEKTTIMDEVHTIRLFFDLSPDSSINYDGHRYSHNGDNKIVNYGLPLEKIDVHINGSLSFSEHMKINKNYDKYSILFYKIGKKSEIFNKTRNNYGIPLCNNSFDFVCFMVSLIKNKHFYETFKTSPELYLSWKLLWKSGEFDDLMRDIENIKKNNYVNIFNTIKKYHIRFDALNYFYDRIFNQ